MSSQSALAPMYASMSLSTFGDTSQRSNPTIFFPALTISFNRNCISLSSNPPSLGASIGTEVGF